MFLMNLTRFEACAAVFLKWSIIVISILIEKYGKIRIEGKVQKVIEKLWIEHCREIGLMVMGGD